MRMRRLKLTVTTDGSGNAVAYSPRIAGEIHGIEYVKTDYANGVDFAITSEATGLNIWTQADVNASAVVYPRLPTHSAAGVAALYAAGGTGVLNRPAIANDRVKIAIAQGGATKVGTFHILVAA